MDCIPNLDSRGKVCFLMLFFHVFSFLQGPLFQRLLSKFSCSTYLTFQCSQERRLENAGGRGRERWCLTQAPCRHSAATDRLFLGFLQSKEFHLRPLLAVPRGYRNRPDLFVEQASHTPTLARICKHCFSSHLRLSKLWNCCC